MRKLVVGLVTAGFLAVAGSAMAQTADPLGLINSGAVIPFVGGGAIAPGSLSFLEVTSPVGDNSGSPGDNPAGLHMFFFDVNCVKGPASVGVPVTENGFAVLRVDNIESTATDGLIAIGATNQSGFALNPVNNPFTARVFWIDALTNTARVLEPISISNAEQEAVVPAFVTSEIQEGVWNPLRTAASFFAPPEALGFDTTLYLICPNRNITGGASSAFPSFPAREAPTAFPPLFPAPAPDVTPSLLVRVFGEDEAFLRNGSTNCSCLTATPITSITGAGDVFSDSAHSGGFFTEMEGNKRNGTAATCDLNQTGPGNAAQDCLINGTQFRIITPSTPAEGPVVFTGYRAITIAGFDIFGRLNGASLSSLQGQVVPAIEIPPGVSGR